MNARTLSMLCAAGATFSLALCVRGQAVVTPAPANTGPVTIPLAPPDANDPAFEKLREMNKRRVATERELYKIRHQYFGDVKKTEIRQAGIARLSEFTDPAVFPSMLTIFSREGDDVREAMLDHFADQKSVEGDTSLAWAAVFGVDKPFRASAAKRVGERSKLWQKIPNSVNTVVAEGLSRHDPAQAGAAANLAGILDIIEAIPMLIQAQAGPGGGAGGGGGGSDDDPNGALAYIFVGTQRSFIASLTPVVGDSAVGFDPVPGVVTDGSVLIVKNAFVTTYVYNDEVHTALVDVSSRAWGRSTAGLGWDQKAWEKWYTTQFVPDRFAARAAAISSTPPPVGPQ